MKWNLEYLYKTKEDFLKDFEELKKLADSFKDYQGKLHQEEMFKEYYLKQIELELKLGKVYEYVALKSDLNKKDLEGLSDLSNVEQLFFKLNQDTAFESPEVLEIGYDKVMGFINNNKELEQFRFPMEKLFRKAKYTLSKEEEKLLSICDPSMSSGGELYSMLAVSDGKVKEVVLSDGTKVKVTQGNWPSLIQDSKCEEDRKVIFEALYETYDNHKNTFASIYKNVMESCKATMLAKGYPTILDSFLYSNNIPTEVYYTLVKNAGEKNDSLKKYLKLRKEYLGLSEYHTYDRFLELAKSNTKYSFEEGKEIFFKSIEKFPEDFKKKAKEALEDGFVDVYESDGKRTGAYSSSQANLHPFILLNYTDTLDDVFTLAHEAGHSMHSLYAMESNPVVLQGYTIFVAEIASTFNEHVLLDYLMSTGKLSKEEKICLLQKAIDNIVGTYYRQTLFAEYELIVSKKVEQGEPITYQTLSNVMIELYNKYYGLDITKEKVKEFVWAYIPHMFYTPFYVYQYATSFAASFAIYENICKNKPNAFEKYVGLLKAGGSKYPIEEALEAGIDFTKKETFEAVTNRMDELVSELEKLLKQ